MSAHHKLSHLNIWIFAFGYFAFYAPYSLAVKTASNGLWPGSDLSLTPVEILPGFLFGATAVVVVFSIGSGWWRYVPLRKTHIGLLPWPRPLAAVSGAGTAAIIITTTMAYTFHGISIVFALLLMRGGVLIMAPIVDALFRRKVAWNSWLGLVLSLAAVTIALADQDSYVLSLAAIANLAIYYAGYVARLQCITAAAKSDVSASKYRFFAEEQIVSMTILMLACGVLSLYAIWPEQVTAPDVISSAPVIFSVPSLIIGVLYGFLFLFGSMIYMDARENCFCIPINRCSSVLAGLVAGTAMVYLFDQPPVTQTQLVAAGFIIAAILSLAKFNPADWWNPLTKTRFAPRRLLLFVCDGNVNRSPLAEAICRSVFADRNPSSNGMDGAYSVEVTSAGLHVKPDQPMSQEAQLALGRLNVQGGTHTARSLTSDLVDQATAIYCMTNRQISDLVAAHPQAKEKVQLLDQHGEINLSAGSTIDDYLECAKHIRQAILERLDSMVSLTNEGQPAFSKLP